MGILFFLKLKMMNEHLSDQSIGHILDGIKIVTKANAEFEKTVDQQNQDLNKKSNDLENSQSLVEKLNKMNDYEVKVLTEKLEEKEQENEKLNQKVKEVQDQNSDTLKFEKRVDQLTQDFNKKSNELENSQSLVEKLNKMNDSEVKAHIEKLKEKEQENEKLKKNVKSLQDQLSEKSPDECSICVQNQQNHIINSENLKPDQTPKKLTHGEIKHDNGKIKFDNKLHDERDLALLGTYEGDIVVYSISQNEIIKDYPQIISGSKSYVTSIVATADNKNIVVCNAAGGVAEIETCSGQVIDYFNLTDVTFTAATPDNQY